VISPAPAYVVRYRCVEERRPPALLVEDARGAAYLFSDDALQVCVAGADAVGRLLALVGRRGAWAPVPANGAATLADLRGLLARPRRRAG
jgi:hypothetical protein